MGVYCLVHMCIESPAPLAAETRVKIVELCREHELLVGTCSVAVPGALPPYTLWQRVRALAGFPRRGFVEQREGAAGDWLDDCARSLPDFRLYSGFAKWKGEPTAGHFSYVASPQPRRVQIVNLYRGRDERSPHDPPDGVIGAFYDVLELESKRNLDGRIAARSAFVRELKKLTGTKIICRASWV